MVVPAEHAVVLTSKPSCVLEIAFGSLNGAVGKVDLVKNRKAHGIVKKMCVNGGGEAPLGV